MNRRTSALISVVLLLMVVVVGISAGQQTVDDAEDTGALFDEATEKADSIQTIEENSLSLWLSGVALGVFFGGIGGGLIVYTRRQAYR